MSKTSESTTQSSELSTELENVIDTFSKDLSDAQVQELSSNISYALKVAEQLESALNNPIVKLKFDAATLAMLKSNLDRVKGIIILSQEEKKSPNVDSKHSTGSSSGPQVSDQKQDQTQPQKVKEFILEQKKVVAKIKNLVKKGTLKVTDEKGQPVEDITQGTFFTGEDASELAEDLEILAKKAKNAEIPVYEMTQDESEAKSQGDLVPAKLYAIPTFKKKNSETTDKVTLFNMNEEDVEQFKNMSPEEITKDNIDITYQVTAKDEQTAKDLYDKGKSQEEEIFEFMIKNLLQMHKSSQDKVVFDNSSLSKISSAYTNNQSFAEKLQAKGTTYTYKNNQTFTEKVNNGKSKENTHGRE